MSRPRITLCVIARDEESMLADCLASARKAVDRVIVVDTGSTDRTVEIARRCGARVVAHEWSDDFAAARNAALEHVKSGFVLVLDADERLAPGGAEALRRAVRRGGFDVGLLPLHHADGADAQVPDVISGRRRLGDPVLLPRLLRRTPELRWEGRVHENVGSWAVGRRVQALGASIAHYGAHAEIRRISRKDERNLALLERRFAEEPDDPSVGAYLARELQRAGRTEEAIEASSRAWYSLLRSKSQGLAHDFVLPVTVHAHLLLEAGRLFELVEVLSRAAQEGFDHPNLSFLTGVAAEQQALAADGAEGLLEEAAACYTRCLEQAGEAIVGEPIPGSRGWQAQVRLGTVELRRGRGEKAFAAFVAALAECPDEPEAALGRAEASLLLGRNDEALRLLEPWGERDQVDAWLLLALAALAVERRDDAAAFGERAVSLAERQHLLAPHRQPLLDELATSLGAAGSPMSSSIGTAQAAVAPHLAGPDAPRLQTPSANPNARSVLVLGSGRSGTSMLAGCLAEAGWYVGDDPHPPRDSNPKGFFETLEINGINEQLLCQVLPSWQRFEPWQRWLAELPPGAELAMDSDLEARVDALVEQRPFAYKDPRFCYTLPAWRPFLEDVGFVCVFRPPNVTAESVLAECASQPYLASLEIDYDRALRVWTDQYRHVVETHRQSGDWLFLHYDQLLNGDGAERLEEFVGAPIERSFPEAALSRSTSDRPVPRQAGELYEALCDLASFDSRGASLATSVSVTPTRTASSLLALSVLLCTYDRRSTLERCVASFEAQTAAPGSFELVVVNDGSNDDTRAWLDGHEFTIPAKVVHRENGGLAAARNTAIGEASGETLLFINDDTMAFPDLVERHLEAQRRCAGDRVAVLGSFEQPPAARSHALTRTLEQTTFVFCFDAMQAGHRYDWTRFWTCNVSVDAEAVRRVGGFDEDTFRSYGCEDTDLGYRLWRDGYEVLYTPDARAHHEHVLDLAGLEARTRTVALAWSQLFAKHPAMLHHPDWRWVLSLDRRACDQYVIDRLPQIEVWRRAAAELADVDLGRLDAANPRLSESVVRALTLPLTELNGVGWHGGLAAGLDALGIDGFRTLVEAPSAAPPQRSVLAWPHYGLDSEVDLLLDEYGASLTESATRLFLVHDETQDGDVESAVHEFEQAYERALPHAPGLDVEIIADPLNAERLAVLRDTVDVVIELPGSEKGPRRELLDALSAPSLRGAST